MFRFKINKLQIINFILLMICIYIYLYNPIFKGIGFGLIKLLIIISILYLFYPGNFQFYKVFKKEIVLTFILILYSLIISFHGENTWRIPYSHLIWFLECFFIPTFIILFFKNIFLKFSWEIIVVQIGFFASLISFFLILNPNINQFVRSSIIMDTLDNSSLTDIIWDFRGFTIAEGASFAYGVVQGLILSICLLLMLKNLKYFIPILFLFISIIFNARTGLVPVFIFIIILLINKQIKLKQILLTMILIFVIGYIVRYSIFAQQNETSLIWALSIFTDTQNFVKGNENSGNYSVLFNQFLFFPSDFLGLIFGKGVDVFGAGDRASDVGYVIQIFKGGILYLTLMLIFLWKLFIRNFKNASNKFFPILFFITIIIVNIKGNAFFLSSSFFRLFTFYYVYSILTSEMNLLNSQTESKI